MRKMFRMSSSMLVLAVVMCIICVPVSAVKYTDGRFIKNTQAHGYIEKIVMQHTKYKDLSDDGYTIRFDRIRFSFSMIKKTNKVHSITLEVPMVAGSSTCFFKVSLFPKIKLSSLDLVNLFLNTNEFNEDNFTFSFNIYTYFSMDWEPDYENDCSHLFSVLTDITEDNWREKFEESVIPELCPHSLEFFELSPGEKVFVEMYFVKSKKKR